MNIKCRREAVEHFESLRGSLNRNLGYAGIAASWAMREGGGLLLWQLVAAIALFASYVMADAIYVHFAAETERKQLRKIEQEYAVQHKGELPSDDYLAPYSIRRNGCLESIARWRGLLLVAGYLLFLYGVIVLLTTRAQHCR